MVITNFIQLLAYFEGFDKATAIYDLEMLYTSEKQRAETFAYSCKFIMLSAFRCSDVLSES